MHIQFMGAAGEVTGSCYLIACGGRQLLLDCGLFQGARETEARNREPFAFDPARIDAVVLSHSHLDHAGRLPLLVKAGFRGSVHTQRASRDLCRIMLKDAGYLNERDVEWDNRKRSRKGLAPLEPLYTVQDARRAMQRFRAVDYDRLTEILPGVRLRLRDAGHILGSSIVELWLSEGGVSRKLVFSGDLGHRGAPILRDPATVADADIVLVESTYGDRLHRSWADTRQELAEVFTEAESRRGNILIPAFAVGRTQELLYLLGQNFDAWGMERWSVFLDSPLAIEATELYERHWPVYDREARRTYERHGSPFALPNLHISRTPNQSMALNRIRSGAIIVAGGGMCEGGRIRHHLKHNIWRTGSHVLIVGFQARGTLGRALVDGARQIRLWGEEMRVAATMHTVGGLSAHADQRGLLDWCGAFARRPTFAVVHGEPEARASLAALLREARGARVLMPRLEERLDLGRLS